MTGPPRLAVAPPAPAQAPATVVIAHGHDLMRRALRQLLGEAAGIEVLAETSDLASTARQLAEHTPDVLVISRKLPDGSTLEFIRAAAGRTPRTGIVVVSVEDAPGFAQRALEAGACGHVPVHLADLELADAVMAAAHGARYVSPSVARGLAEHAGRRLAAI